MLKDFLGNIVKDGDDVVCANPFFPSLWVKAIARENIDGIYKLEYKDSKKRIQNIRAVSGGQFILIK